MNNYLLSLGSAFTDIRQILNLTQEDLAHLIGVSRPTVVKIEQDPSRLTRTVAYAFFIAVSYELQKRKMEVEKINPEEYKKPEAINDFVTTIKRASLLTTAGLGTVTALGLGNLFPNIGRTILVAAGLNYALKQNSKKKSEGIEEKAEWNEEKAEMIIEEVKKKLREDQNKVIAAFQLEKLDITLFVSKINEHESFD